MQDVGCAVHTVSREGPTDTGQINASTYPSNPTKAKLRCGPDPPRKRGSKPSANKVGMNTHHLEPARIAVNAATPAATKTTPYKA